MTRVLAMGRKVMLGLRPFLYLRVLPILHNPSSTSLFHFFSHPIHGPFPASFFTPFVDSISSLLPSFLHASACLSSTFSSKPLSLPCHLALPSLSLLSPESLHFPSSLPNNGLCHFSFPWPFSLILFPSFPSFALLCTCSLAPHSTSL